MLSRVLPIVLLATACVSAARASTILDNVAAQAYRDEAALYPMVGKVTGGFLNGSGVMISDRWVLTAGHINAFRSGGIYSVGGVDYTIQTVINHPLHTPAFSNTYDVGLLYLSAPVVGIEAATMYRFDSPSSLLGREATWVGNGVTGTGLDEIRGANEMRAFTNVIDGVTPFIGLPGPSFYSDFDNPDGTSNSLGNSQGSSATPTRLEGNVTGGDSGGGVFVMVDGKPYLVGIGSYASFSSVFPAGVNSKYGAFSGAADLSAFHSWIYDNTGIQAIPEPSALTVALLGASIALRRRR